MTYKTLILAATVAVSSPALANENDTLGATVSAYPETQEVVSFADLDLSDRSGQRTLNRRVMRASERLCIRVEGKFNVNRYLGGKENSCAVRTYRHAKGQISTAIARAERGEAHRYMAVVISHEEPQR